VTFPRLAAAGFWTWLVGVVLVVISIASNGGPSGGNSRFVALFLASHIAVLIGLIAAAGSVATTVLTARAPGMNMRRIPMFAWSALIGSLGMLLVLPAVLGVLIYTYVDYQYGRVGFGGNLAINDWIGFGFTQPATIVYSVVAFGFAIEVIAVSSGRKLPKRGIIYTGIGLLGIVAALGAMLQEPSILVGGFDDLPFGLWVGEILSYGFFNLLPVLGGFIVISLGCARPTQQQQDASDLAAGLRPARRPHGVRRCCRQRRVPGRRCPPPRHGLRRGRVVVHRVRRGAQRAGCDHVLGARSCGVARSPTRQRFRSRPSVSSLLSLAALPMLIAGFADQPANASEFDYSGPQNLWNALSATGHVLMLLTVLAFAGLAIPVVPQGRRSGRRPVGRPHVGMGHVVAGPVRQLHRRTHRRLSRTPTRSQATETRLMLALPSAAPPAPKRQTFVGTALGCVAAGSLVGAMLALWMLFRTEAVDSAGQWVPKGIKIPMVPANTMLLCFVLILVFAQWTVYAAKNEARSHTALGLALVGIIGAAIVNAQAYIYARMKMPIIGDNATPFNAMFYAITGTFTLLIVLRHRASA
jgi:heme/copper-type cytochrome/quinol oxidase subunit 3